MIKIPQRLTRTEHNKLRSYLRIHLVGIHYAMLEYNFCTDTPPRLSSYPWLLQPIKVALIMEWFSTCFSVYIMKMIRIKWSTTVASTENISCIERHELCIWNYLARSPWYCWILRRLYVGSVNNGGFHIHGMNIIIICCIVPSAPGHWTKQLALGGHHILKKTGVLLHLSNNNTVIWTTLWPDSTWGSCFTKLEGELPSHVVLTRCLVLYRSDEDTKVFLYLVKANG